MSSVAIVPIGDRVGISVGILGKFLGFISVPKAKLGFEFPNNEKEGVGFFMLGENLKVFPFKDFKLTLFKILTKTSS